MSASAPASLPVRPGTNYICSVAIIQARNLVAADRGLLRSTSDPYVQMTILLSDGSELGPVQTKYIPKSLNPVWNRRIELNCGDSATHVPVAVRFKCFDYDRLSKHDPLGHATIQLPTVDGAYRWLPLQDAKHGELQVQVAVQAIDSHDPAGKLKLASADRVGLISLRMEGVTDLAPGPLAVNALGSSAFKRGEYSLRLVLQYGLRQFNSRPEAGPPMAALAAPCEAAPAVGGGSLALHQDCKVWQREGEQKYMAQVTLYAVGRPDARTGKSRSVALGRGYANTAALSDSNVHAFKVYLREEAPRQMELTDAEQSVMLAAQAGIVAVAAAAAGAGSSGSASAMTHVSVPPSVANAAEVGASAAVVPSDEADDADLPPGAESVDGSGFRSAAPGLKHTDSLRGAPEEDSPREGEPGVLAGSGSSTPVIEHTSGLEETLKGPVTACVSLRAVLESRDKVEGWFFQRLLAEFDADGNGRLDRTEMLAMLHTLGSTMRAEELEALVAELDTDGDGQLDGAELVEWFRSPSFQAVPLAYSLLAFLADGRKGLDELVNDVTRAVSATELTTSAGAAILALNEGDRVVLADRGLKIFDRQTGLIMTEHIPTAVATAINLMYHSSLGSSFTSSAAVRALLARLSASEGAKMDTPASRAKIPDFVRLHGINLEECLVDRVEGYPTFNAFFTRELKPAARPIAAPLDDGVLVSPADSRTVVYPSISDATKIWVKGRSFTVEGLLGPECADVAPLFLGGSLLLARLAPQDYHRWHLPVTGRLGRRHRIDGALYTVNPIAIRRTNPDVYSHNKREVLLVHTKPFGLVAMVAVGATVVGSINIVTPDGAFAEKGACHGYFAFGGSTVLVLFQPGTVAFDADLLKSSATPLETYVRVGEHIGTAVAPAAAHAGAIAADDVDYAAYLLKARAAV